MPSKTPPELRDFPCLALPAQLKTLLLREHKKLDGEVIYGERAVLVTAFLSGSYLSVEGHAFLIDYVEQTPPVLVTDAFRILGTIIIASHTLGHLGFLELLPRQPPDTKVCPRCSGKRWEVMAEEGFLCWECGGLGWGLMSDEKGKVYTPNITTEGTIELVLEPHVEATEPARL